MPRVAKELTALEVKRIKTAGMHAVGGVAGLLLQVRMRDGSDVPSARSWILRTRLGAERIHMGLGPYPTVGLSEAREAARARLLECRQGINPIQKRKADRSALLATQAKAKTFKEVADAYIKAHTKAFSNEKHRQQWQTTLEAYAYPLIGNRLVSSITMADIVTVLEQPTEKNPRSDKPAGKFWEVKTETASRVQGRIKSILDYAIVKEYRTGSNPALWDGVLSTQLPSPKKIAKVKHHPALPYSQAPKFMKKLRENQSTSAAALQFLILTAVRSGSVRLAKWEEIDLQKKIWTIPPENTKTKEEHRVPLSPEAIKLLNKQPKFTNSALIFPGKGGRPLSDMALSELMKGMFERGEMNQHAVPHGWRSTFRDWAADKTNYPDEIRKLASGHAVNDAVKVAYQRTDLLDRRRQLMGDWSKFLAMPTSKARR
jgi:integrase